MNDPRYIRAPLATVDAFAAQTRLPVSLFSLAGALPPAFVIHFPIHHDDEDALLAAIVIGNGVAGLRSIDDPLHRVALATLPTGEHVTEVSPTWKGTAAIDVKVSGNGGAVIGVKTAFLVGWHGTQNGRPLRVVRATGNHVAVVVDDVTAGTIELRYTAPGLSIGIVSSLCGVLLAAILAIRAFRSRRRQSSPAGARA